MTAPLLSASQLAYAYPGAQPLFSRLDLALAPGQFTCLLGPNGCGKTTLLRCLLGRLRPSAGDIRLLDKPLAKWSPRARARRLAYLPQRPEVAFGFSVREILRLARFPHRESAAATEHRVNAVLEQVGLAPLADRPLQSLSGGEAQRVMLARALTQDPRVLLLDEPANQLDPRTRLRLYGLIRQAAHRDNLAVLCISHDVNLAAQYADRLTFLADGRIQADGPPGEILDPHLLGRIYRTAAERIPHPGGDLIRFTDPAAETTPAANPDESP
ncbi:MAG: ABC transporter ATP-binding protein [Candidatus Marinimicrobia bacterium]|nr:ABC transporter ATP-binding protein [Candidatus Neomarinimicrobiota bacterium]